MRVDLATLKRLLELDPMGRLLINEDSALRTIEFEPDALAHLEPLRAKARAARTAAETEARANRAKETARAERKRLEREEDARMRNAIREIQNSQMAHIGFGIGRK
jgi:hypothetical protein